MKSKLITLLLAAILLSTHALASRLGLASGPELKLPKSTRDYGDVFAGEELEEVFYVGNSGDAPLELAEKSLTSADLNGRRSLYSVRVVTLSRRAAPS